MSYKKIEWKNYPSTETPISATNLEHMDDGIMKNDQAIGDMEKVKELGDGTLAGAVSVLNEGSVRFSTFEGTVDNWGSIGIVYPSDAHMLIGAYSSDYLLVPETHNPSVKFDSFRCFGRLQVQQLAIAPNGAKIKGWFYYI